jgi:hypothetical protein
MNWFKAEYDKTNAATAVMIHPSRIFDKQAAPPDTTVCVDRDGLAALIDNVRKYSAALASANALTDKEAVAKNLKQFGLTASDFLSKFTKQPGKRR